MNENLVFFTGMKLSLRAVGSIKSLSCEPHQISSLNNYCFGLKAPERERNALILLSLFQKNFRSINWMYSLPQNNNACSLYLVCYSVQKGNYGIK